MPSASDSDARTANLGPSQSDATADLRSPSSTPRERAPLSDAPEVAALPTVERSVYAVQRELARGGMGRIVVATDRRLQRPVAVKEALESQHYLRFEREVLLTAQLQHPNIVSIYEAGRWPSGEPFYAMRLIPGRPLDEIVDAAKLWAARLALLPNVIAATDALGYAHEQGVIHRDLKPANILVGSHGDTVVIDWGLAKRVRDVDDVVPASRAALRDDSLTSVGSIMGTPRFMPREQSLGDAVDERADVYALGAILYFVLGGKAPYHEAVSMTQVLGLLASSKPPKPLVEIAPEAPRDLVAIVERAMALEAGDRYATAKELAEDLRRFQTGQLVRTHDYTLRELVMRWLRRYRFAVGVTLAAVALIAIVGVTSYRNVVGERDRAEAAVARATVAGAAEAAATAREVARNDDLIIDAAHRALPTDATSAIAQLKLLSPHSARYRSASAIVEQASLTGVAGIAEVGAPVRVLEASADQHHVVVGDATGGVWRINPDTAVATRIGSFAHPITAIAVAATGSRIAVTTDGEPTRWWSADTKQWTPLAGTTPSASIVALSSTGDRLAHLAGPRVLESCPLPAGPCVQATLTSDLRGAFFTTDTKRLFAITTTEVVAFTIGDATLTPAWHQPLAVAPTERGHWFAWSADTQTLAWVSLVGDRRRLFAIPNTSAPTLTVIPYDGPACNADESYSGGDRVDATSSWASANVVVSHTGPRTDVACFTNATILVGVKPPLAALEHFDELANAYRVLAVAFAPNGDVSYSRANGELRAAHFRFPGTPAGEPIRMLLHLGDTLVSAGDRGEVRFWRVRAQVNAVAVGADAKLSRTTGLAVGISAADGGRAFGALPDSADYSDVAAADVDHVLLAADDELALLVPSTGAIRLWHPRANTLAPVTVAADRIIAISKAHWLGRRPGEVVAGSWQGAASHARLACTDTAPIATSPDLATIAVGDAATARVAGAAGDHVITLVAPARALALSADAHWLVASDADGTLELCAVASSTCRTLVAADAVAKLLRFSADSSRVLAVGSDRTRVFDTATGAMHVTPGLARGVAISPDGRYVVLADRELVFVDTGDVDALGAPDQTHAAIDDAAFVHWGESRAEVVVLQRQLDIGFGDDPRLLTSMVVLPFGRLPTDERIRAYLDEMTNATIVNGELAAE